MKRCNAPMLAARLLIASTADFPQAPFDEPGMFSFVYPNAVEQGLCRPLLLPALVILTRIALPTRDARVNRRSRTSESPQGRTLWEVPLV